MCLCEHRYVCIKARQGGALKKEGGDYGPWQAKIRTMCPTGGQIWSCY